MLPTSWVLSIGLANALLLGNPDYVLSPGDPCFCLVVGEINKFWIKLAFISQETEKIGDKSAICQDLGSKRG